MSRRFAGANSRVRGPHSALTDFLREKGVSAQDIQQRARQRAREAEQAAAQAAAEAAGNTPDDAVDPAEEVGESSGAAARRPGRARAPAPKKVETKTSRRRSKAAVEADDDDEEMFDIPEDTDEDEEEEEVIVKTRRGRPARGSTSAKSKKAQEAAKKKKQKKRASKKRKFDSDDDDDSDDLDFEMYAKSVPVPGQIAFCADCNCRFTVTTYSKSAPDGDGLLCHACGKKNASSEAAARKKKQVTRVHKKSTARALLDGDGGGVKSLQEMCIQLVAKHIDDVDALGEIGYHNMDKICQIISKNRSLTNQTIKLFLEPGEKKLRFYDCSKIDSDVLLQIATFVPTTQQLLLKFCGRMNDSCLTYYAEKLPNLTSLEVYGAFNVTETCWIDFFTTVGPRLKHFGIGDTSRFRASAISALVDNCPELETLRMKTLTNLDDECIRLLTGLPNLTTLEISNPSMSAELTDGPIIDILNTCGSALVELNLDSCIDLTDSLLHAIHQSCGQLKVLSLSSLELLTDEGITRLFKHWDINSGLTHLNIERCIALSSEGFAAIIGHSGHSLENLNINSCKELTSDDWEILGGTEGGLPHLEDVDVGFIRSVGDGVVETLGKVAPSLRIVRIWGCFRVSDAVEVRGGVGLVGREADILA